MRTINAFATFLFVFVLAVSTNYAFSVPMQPTISIRHADDLPDGYRPIISYAHSSDGQQLSTGLLTVKLWDARTGGLIQEYPNFAGFVKSLSFSPDNEYLFIGHDSYRGVLLDFQKGEELFRIKTAGADESTPILLGITGIAFLPQNKSFLTADFQGFIQEWDIESGEEIQRYRTLPGVQGISLLADGNYLYIQRLTTGVILDLRTGAIIKEYEAYRYSVSPNASYLALLTSPEISIVDARTFEVVSMYPHPEWIESMAVSNDGKTLLLGAWADSEEHKRERLIIDLNTRSIAAEYPVQVSDDRNSYLSTDDGVALFPDHRRFLTRNLSTIHIWDISDLVADVPDSALHDD